MQEDTPSVGGLQQEMCPVVCVFSVHCAPQVCKSRSRFSLSIDVGGKLNSLENQKYKKSLRAIYMYYYPIYYNCIIILGEHEVKGGVTVGRLGDIDGNILGGVGHSEGVALGVAG